MIIPLNNEINILNKNLYLDRLQFILNGKNSQLEERKIQFIDNLSNTDFFFQNLLNNLSNFKGKNSYSLFLETKKWIFDFLNQQDFLNEKNIEILIHFIKNWIAILLFHEKEFILFSNLHSFENSSFILEQTFLSSLFMLIISMKSAQSILSYILDNSNTKSPSLNENLFLDLENYFLNSSEIIEITLASFLQYMSLKDFFNRSYHEVWYKKELIDYLNYDQKTNEILTKKSLNSLTNYIKHIEKPILENKYRKSNFLYLVNQLMLESFPNPWYKFSNLHKNISLAFKNLNNRKLISYFFNKTIINSLSLYPLGTLVILSTKESGIVINNVANETKILILFSKNRNLIKNPFVLNLNRYPNIKIIDSASYQEIYHIIPKINEKVLLFKKIN